MWVAGTLCLSTLKYRSASEKGFSSIMASKNILLELSVLERLSHFATSNLNARQEVARISRGLLCLARFLFQNASCQCHIYNWEAHRLDWGFGYASRGLSVKSVWQAATLLPCMHAKASHTAVALCQNIQNNSSCFLFLWALTVPGKSETQWAATKHNCTLLQPFL